MFSVDYYFYQNTYKGSEITSQNNFDVIYARHVYPILKQLTYGRIDGELDENTTYLVKMCACEIADNVVSRLNSVNGVLNEAVQSESLGSWHKTYKTSNGNSISDITELSNSICHKWFNGTNLLYAGFNIENPCFLYGVF